MRWVGGWAFCSTHLLHPRTATRCGSESWIGGRMEREGCVCVCVGGEVTPRAEEGGCRRRGNNTSGGGGERGSGDVSGDERKLERTSCLSSTITIAIHAPPPPAGTRGDSCSKRGDTGGGEAVLPATSGNNESGGEEQEGKVRYS